MTVEEMRALFPSAQQRVHMNHAGVSPIARPVVEAVTSLTQGLTAGDPSTAFPSFIECQTQLRAALGRMLNADPGSICFTKNTSHGLSIIASALPLQPGDEIVVASNEYPSNLYPWMAQERRGARVRLVPPREDGYVAEEDLIAACSASEGRARVLTVSWVQWGTGQRMDMARLGSFCRERGIFFVADVVQGLGALRFDTAALPWVDAVAAGSHKWLMAPAGIGVLFIRPELMLRLLPANIGWNSVVDPVDWERIHFDELKPTADRFEEGTPNVLGTVGLAASVEILESVGFDRVEESVLAVADALRTGLTKHGCRVISPDAPQQRSGIVSFRHPRLSNDIVLAALTERGVNAAVRCGNVRLSPHAYNNDADVNTVLSILSSL